MEYLAHAYSPIEEESVNEEEIYRLLFELIDKLPLRCREIFLLYMEGYMFSVLHKRRDARVVEEARLESV